MRSSSSSILLLLIALCVSLPYALAQDCDVSSYTVSDGSLQCSGTLSDGSTCGVTCNSGFTSNGESLSCSAGALSGSPACNADAPPSGGDASTGGGDSGQSTESTADAPPSDASTGSDAPTDASTGGGTPTDESTGGSSPPTDASTSDSNPPTDASTGDSNPPTEASTGDSNPPSDGSTGESPPTDMSSSGEATPPETSTGGDDHPGDTGASGMPGAESTGSEGGETTSTGSHEPPTGTGSSGGHETESTGTAGMTCDISTYHVTSGHLDVNCPTHLADGGNCAVVCDQGFHSNGDSVTCSSGSLSGSPQCTADAASSSGPAPPTGCDLSSVAIVDGNLDPSCAHPLPDGSYCRAVCNAGFSWNQVYVYCNGTRLIGNPLCVIPSPTTSHLTALWMIDANTHKNVSFDSPFAVNYDDYIANVTEVNSYYIQVAFAAGSASLEYYDADGLELTPLLSNVPFGPIDTVAGYTYYRVTYYSTDGYSDTYYVTAMGKPSQVYDISFVGVNGGTATFDSDSDTVFDPTGNTEYYLTVTGDSVQIDSSYTGGTLYLSIDDGNTFVPLSASGLSDYLDTEPGTVTQALFQFQSEGANPTYTYFFYTLTFPGEPRAPSVDNVLVSTSNPSTTSNYVLYVGDLFSSTTYEYDIGLAWTDIIFSPQYSGGTVTIQSQYGKNYTFTRTYEKSPAFSVPAGNTTIFTMYFTPEDGSAPSNYTFWVESAAITGLKLNSDFALANPFNASRTTYRVTGVKADATSLSIFPTSVYGDVYISFDGGVTYSLSSQIDYSFRSINIPQRIVTLIYLLFQPWANLAPTIIMLNVEGTGGPIQYGLYSLGLYTYESVPAGLIAPQVFNSTAAPVQDYFFRVDAAASSVALTCQFFGGSLAYQIINYPASTTNNRNKVYSLTTGSSTNFITLPAAPATTAASLPDRTVLQINYTDNSQPPRVFTYNFYIEQAYLQSVSFSSPQVGYINYTSSPFYFTSAVTNYTLVADASVQSVQIQATYAVGELLFNADVIHSPQFRGLKSGLTTSQTFFPDSGTLLMAVTYRTGPGGAKQDITYYFTITQTPAPLGSRLSGFRVASNDDRDGTAVVWQPPAVSFNPLVFNYFINVAQYVNTAYLSFDFGSDGSVSIATSLDGFNKSALVQASASTANYAFPPAISDDIGSSITVLATYSTFVNGNIVSTVYSITLTQEAKSSVTFARATADSILSADQYGRLYLDASNLNITSIASGDLDKWASAARAMGYTRFGLDLSGNLLAGLPANLLPKSQSYGLTFLNLSSNNIKGTDLKKSVFNNGIQYMLDLSNNPLKTVPKRFVSMWWTSSGLASPSVILRNCGLSGISIDSTAFLITPPGFNSIDLSGNDLSNYSPAKNIFPTTGKTPVFFRPCRSDVKVACGAEPTGFFCGSCKLTTVVTGFIPDMRIPRGISATDSTNATILSPMNYDLSGNQFVKKDSLKEVGLVLQRVSTRIVGTLDLSDCQITTDSRSAVTITGMTFNNIDFSNNNITLIRVGFVNVNVLNNLDFSNSNVMAFQNASGTFLNSKVGGVLNFSNCNLGKADLSGVFRGSGYPVAQRLKVQHLDLSNTGITNINNRWFPYATQDLTLAYLNGVTQLSMRNFTVNGTLSFRGTRFLNRTFTKDNIWLANIAKLQFQNIITNDPFPPLGDPTVFVNLQGLALDGWDFSSAAGSQLSLAGISLPGISLQGVVWPGAKKTTTSPTSRRLLANKVGIPPNFFNGTTVSYLDLSNSGLTYLTADMFTGLIVTQQAPGDPADPTSLTFDGNDFSAPGSLGYDTFSLFADDNSVYTISMQNCGLNANSFFDSTNNFNAPFKTGNINQIDLGNDDTLGFGASNVFNPFPSGFFNTLDFSANILQVRLGDIVTLPSQMFGDYPMTSLDLEMHFAPGVDAANEVVKAATGYSNLFRTPDTTGFSWTISGYNFTLSQSNLTNYVSTSIPTATDNSQVVLTPSELIIPYEPNLLRKDFFTVFNGIKSLTLNAPSPNKDYNANETLQAGPIYSDSGIFAAFGEADVPWHPILKTNAADYVTSDLLTPLQNLESFTMVFPTTLPFGVGGKYSPIPDDFFVPLGGSETLKKLDLYYAQIIDFPTRLLNGLIWSIPNITLNFDMLLTPTTPVPIGFFDPLDASTHLYPAISTLSDNAQTQFDLHAPYCSADGGCQPCPPGSFPSASTNGISYCKYCPIGSYCPTGRRSILCPPGFYQNKQNTTACIPCQPGTWNDNYGSAQSFTCSSCPSGTWQPVYNATGPSFCLACPLGHYTTGIAVGVPCDECPAGTYADVTGLRTCKSCPINTYNPNTGAQNISSCIACPALRYTAAASTSENQCLPQTCAFGKYTGNIGICQDTCPAGSYCPGVGGLRVQCPVGSWAAAGAARCTNCPIGFFGANVVGGATKPSDCLPCPYGTYGNTTGAPVCFTCQVNTLNNVLNATSASFCLPCGLNATSPDSDSFQSCPTGSAEPLTVSGLLNRAAFVASANDTTIGAVLPDRSGPSLRLTVPGWAPDTILTNAVAEQAVDGGGAPTPTFDPTAPQIDTQSMTACIVVLCIAAAFPFFLYKWIPPTVVEYLDQFCMEHELDVGEAVKYRPCKYGAGVSGAWVFIGLLQAIQLGTANNALVTSALVAPTAYQNTGTAQGLFEITLRAVGPSGPNQAWCGQPIINSSFVAMDGFEDELYVEKQYVNGQTCAIAYDIKKSDTEGLELDGKSVFTIALPWFYQTIEWEVFIVGATPGTWSRLYQILTQVVEKGSSVPRMLDASGQFSFTLVESYYEDRMNSNFYTGYEMSYTGYQTLVKQDAGSINANSVVQLAFVFNKADVVYTTIITQKTPIIDLLSAILAAVLALISLFGLFFTFTIDQLHRVGLSAHFLPVDYEALKLAEEERQAQAEADAASMRKDKKKKDDDEEKAEGGDAATNGGDAVPSSKEAPEGVKDVELEAVKVHVVGSQEPHETAAPIKAAIAETPAKQATEVELATIKPSVAPSSPSSSVAPRSVVHDTAAAALAAASSPSPASPSQPLHFRYGASSDE